VWAQVRNGTITEAGLNQTALSFNTVTGLKAPQAPRK